MGILVISPPWIKHPWAFQLSYHHGSDIHGRFSYLTTMNQTSMGNSYLTTMDWTSIGPPVISPPWIEHPCALSDSYHHRSEIYEHFSVDSPP